MMHFGCCATFTGRPCDCETAHDTLNPDRHGFDDNVRADLFTDSGRLALQARSEYEAMTPDERMTIYCSWWDANARRCVGGSDCRGRLAFDSQGDGLRVSLAVPLQR